MAIFSKFSAETELGIPSLPMPGVFGNARSHFSTAHAGNFGVFTKVSAPSALEAGQTLYGTYLKDTLVGGSGNDTIEGFSANDLLFGNAGDDFLTGDQGNDTLFGGEGDDHLYSGSGRNQLWGGAGHDEMTGGQNEDRLIGDLGNDSMAAGDGNDTLWGGQGVDVMFGGLGSDVFQFKAADESGTTWATLDKIEDFQDDFDIIHLGFIDADPDRSGNQAFRLSETGLFDGDAGSLRVIARNGDTLIIADLDGDMISDFTIKLEGLHTLTAQNLIL